MDRNLYVFLNILNIPTYRASTQNHANLVPTEYELSVTYNGHQHNTPCAVCKTTRTDNLMMPARTSCYSGWTFEYQGYLVTEHENLAHSTEFICMDKDYDLFSWKWARSKPINTSLPCGGGLQYWKHPMLRLPVQ